SFGSVGTLAVRRRAASSAAGTPSVLSWGNVLETFADFGMMNLNFTNGLDAFTRVAEIDARCDIKEPGGAVARALAPQRCSPVHGDGRDGRGGPDRGRWRPCHSHGGRPAGGWCAEDRDCGCAGGARDGTDRLHLGARHSLLA